MEITKIHGNRGRKQTPEHKLKRGISISKVLKGRHLSPSSEFKKGCIPWNKGIKTGIVTKGTLGIPSSRKGRKSPISGERHYNWQGGITKENDRIRNSLDFKLWRKSVFERDNYVYQECGIKNGLGKTIKLHAHHKKPFAWFPELRFAIDNGLTLCVDCHKKTDTYAGKIKRK